MTDDVDNTIGDPSEPVPERPAGPARPFYGKPYWWLVFAIALVLTPVIGYLVRADMVWDELHPAINALLNATGAVFLTTGYLAIRRKHKQLHMQCMLSAVALSLLFLVSYVIRYSMSGSHRYPGTGIDKTIYLIILFSHMVLAALTLPMVARTVYLAWRDRLQEHRRLARITFPLWLYVSVTGVIVYLMLYHIAGA
jgi:putative membrane protein